MEVRKIIFLILILCLMIILLVSFSTKGAHWDQISHKSGAEEQFPEVYRGLEGLISLDVMLFSICVPTVISFHQQRVGLLKALQLLITLMLIIRLILSICFLGGNDNYCRQKIDDYSKVEDALKEMYGEPNIWSTLRTAWGFEIFTVIAVDILGGVILFFTRREIKWASDTSRN